MTIIFLCVISFLVKYLQEEKVFFPPSCPSQVSRSYSVRISEWKGEISVSRTYLKLTLEAFTGLPAMPPIQLAGQSLPCLPLEFSFILLEGIGEKIPQTSFEVLYIIKSHLGCDCFWLKQGASLNEINDTSICLEDSAFLSFSLTGEKS